MTVECSREKVLTQIRDLLWPGVRMWCGKGIGVDTLVIRDGGVYLRLSDGTEHVLAAPEEVDDASFRSLFPQRMAALIPVSNGASG